VEKLNAVKVKITIKTQANSRNTTAILKSFAKKIVEVEDVIIHFQPPITGRRDYGNLKPSKEIGCLKRQ
jgi:hypothetical protein